MKINKDFVYVKIDRVRKENDFGLVTDTPTEEYLCSGTVLKDFRKIYMQPINPTVVIHDIDDSTEMLREGEKVWFLKSKFYSTHIDDNVLIKWEDVLYAE